MDKCCCVEVVNVEVLSGDSVVFTISPKNFFNGWCATLLIGMSLPINGPDAASTMAGNEFVFITDGTTTYPLLTPLGNQVLSGQLCWEGICGKQTRYRIAYAATTGQIPNHFTLFNCLPLYAKFRVVGQTIVNGPDP